MSKNTCCFLGHRTINETEELRRHLRAIIERLITEEKVDTFLFGSKSRFNSLCWELVTGIKEIHPHIRRVYVRAEFPVIDEMYTAYLLERYEETYYSPRLIGAGRAVYVERNCEMIDKSRFCVVYYHEEDAPTARKSGTAIALDYAVKRNKNVIRI